MPHIFDALHEDHEKVAQLLKEIKKSGDEDSALRSELLAQVQQELTLHARFEEQEVYPAIEEALGEEEKIEHARDEHAEAMDLLETVTEKVEEDEKGWEKDLEALTKAIQHHVHEEEENIFPKARKKLSKSKAEKLASDYLAAKEKVAAE